MKLRSTVLVALTTHAALAGATEPTERFWPEWRGPAGTGAAPHAQPPLEWNEEAGVAWKIELPGLGHSSPIVWQDLVFVTTAVPIEKDLEPRPTAEPSRSQAPSAQRFQVLAYQRSDGALRWATTTREEFPHEGTHNDGSFASASAITDGEHLFAFFGSRGLYCLDMQGRIVWEKDLGLMSTRLGFGEGASPALHGDTLVVMWDHEGDSFIVALDKRSGDELWRTPRDERTSWATPLVVEYGGVTQVVTGGTTNVRSYDLATGKLLWQLPGLTANVIPTPIFDGRGRVYLTSGFRGNALMAVDLADAPGAAEPAVVAWRYDEDTPYVPSPLLYDGGLYFLKSNSAILTRLDADTGSASFTSRLEGLNNVYASPVAAAGRVYVVSREGATAVLEAGPELKLLGVNVLDDGFDASPALVDDELYLRGRRHLYRIGETP